MSNFEHKVIINLEDKEKEMLESASSNEDHPRYDKPIVAIGCPRFQDDNSPDFDNDTLYPGDIVSYCYSYKWADGYTEFVVIFYPEGCELIELPAWQEIQKQYRS